MIAKIYPLSPKINNEAEKVMYDKFSAFLTENYIAYYNYTVTGKEFDFCVIEKNKAIFIIEVKGWENVQIIEVKDNNSIEYRDRNNNIKEWGSPFKQVTGYRFDMINEIKNRFNKNPLIIGMVCYPFITLEKYKSKRLEIVSEENLTILQNDLIDSESLLNKLNKAVELIKHNKNYDELDEALFKNIRSMYESDLQIENHSNIETHNDVEENVNFQEFIKLPEKNPSTENSKIHKAYSLLKYVKSNKSDEEISDLATEVISLWKKGTKIMLASDSEDLLNKVKLNLEQNLGYLNKYKDFKIRNSDNKFKLMIFNFNFIRVTEELYEEFEVIDGTFDDKVRGYLEALDKWGNFNIHQYEVEHAPLKQDICVKAGAGSGKTFSMTGRINYLIYKHGYTFENVVEKFILITFTNEAADNMKKKLKEYFRNYYLLTCNYDSFRMIEAVERMNISTIHSLCKKIISKYSVQLGMGKDISIVQGKYEKDKIIKEKLNEYLKKTFKSTDNPIEQLGFQMFELQKILSNLLEKIEQKNVDLRDDYFWGKGVNNKLHNLIIYVLTEVQKELIKINDERSSVRLSHIIIKLKELLKEAKLQKGDAKVEYLFVDEFQDSDNIQIEVMKEFGSIFEFNFFVVGDIKQCIYRFRGAEDQAFDVLIKEDEELWKQCKLVKNYRTDKKLLDSFHPIFENMNKVGVLNYDPNPNGDRLIGTVNINSLDKKFFECKSYSTEEEQIKKLVQCIDEEKTKLNDNEKVAVLVRTNSEIEKVREACKNEGIAIATEGYGDLYQIKPAYDLYKLILALKHYKDPKYIFGLYDTCYISESMPKVDIFNYRKDKIRLYEYFQEKMPIKDWNEYIRKLRLQPVMKVIREIIDSVKPWENYGEAVPDEDKINIKNYYKKNLEQLIEVIVNKFNNDYVTINKIEEFLNIMIFTKVNEESREDLNLEEINQNVLCTTIHKSKGLEYKVVIMPFCDKDISCKVSAGDVDVIVNDNNIGYSIRKGRDTENVLSYERIENNIYKNNNKTEKTYKMHEEARIFYVAMTRAIEKFVWFKNDKTKVKESWQKYIGGGK